MTVMVECYFSKEHSLVADDWVRGGGEGGKKKGTLQPKTNKTLSFVMKINIERKCDGII